MKLKIEVNESQEKILIVDKNQTTLCLKLKEELKKLGIMVFISEQLPRDLSIFFTVFLINTPISTSILEEANYQKIIFLYAGFDARNRKMERNVLERKTLPVKIININSFHINKDNFENILWFSLSKSKEKILNIHLPLSTDDYQDKKVKKKSFDFRSFIKKLTLKKIIFFIIFFTLVSHLLFIPPLLFSSLNLYRSINFLSKEDFAKSNGYLFQADKFLNITKRLYGLPHRTLLFFSINSFIDDLIATEEKTSQIISESLTLVENSQEIFKLFLNNKKTDEDTKLFEQRFKKEKLLTDKLRDDLSFLQEKIPKNIPLLAKKKPQIKELITTIGYIERFFPYLDDLLAKDTEKKYLLLFANNMELRPGGGFIGSFGILTIKNMALKEIKVYDVYDADGQLNAHVDPPEFIKKYLDQPHWFLRDSAYTADFPENYQAAKFFLDKEMALTDFSGSIIFTTSSIKKILNAFDKIYLSDFNEIVTSDNFYLKAQYYSDKNFFAGSTQKKSFLSSLTRHLLINLEKASLVKLGNNLKKALDEKEMAIFFESTETEKIIDSLYWSGKILHSDCPLNLTNCYPDYFFPIDSNVGVNKANFFVSRSMEFSVNIDKEGLIHNTVILKYKNESQGEVFPGGTYKNYLQLLLPVQSILKRITKNDVLVEDFDQQTDDFKRVGVFFEIKPQQNAEIKIDYQSSFLLEKGRAYYQLLLQKQIGSNSNDLVLKISLPSNIYLINQNYSPLVKDRLIFYNTQLTTDKIFFNELVKE